MSDWRNCLVVSFCAEPGKTVFGAGRMVCMFTIPGLDEQ